jgi:hypothetical protein
MRTFFISRKDSFFEYILLCCWLFSFLSITTVLIYLVAHGLLYQNTSFHWEEVSALLRMIGVELLFSSCLILLLYLAENREARRSRSHQKKMVPRKALLAASAFFLFLNAGGQSPAGSRRDAATGLQTSHTILKSSRTKLIMNGEVLGHAQIPLGESFTIVNESVSGFTQKEGKVSVGCSLKITDRKGRVMLQMADLFAAKDIFLLADVNNLKCTVSTGKPMDWDEQYHVTVVFWDKWGKGKITNRLTIETIDIP